MAVVLWTRLACCVTTAAGEALARETARALLIGGDDDDNEVEAEAEAEAKAEDEEAEDEDDDDEDEDETGDATDELVGDEAAEFEPALS